MFTVINEFDRKNIKPEWMDLVEDYPEIFLNPSPRVIDWYAHGVVEGYKNIPDNVTDLCNLRYGFECDIGWKQIIREFCDDIRLLIQKAKDNGHEIHFSTFILKEKFGECYSQGDYYGPDTKLYWKDYSDLVENLQKKSSTVCEVTGKPGKLVRRNYWVKTLCEELEEDYEKYRI